MNILSCFDGISCGQLALKRAKVSYDKYYASEVDKNAIKVALNNFPNTIEIGDVRNVNSKKLERIDMLIGGSPCQSFSFAGKRNGMTTKDNIEISTLEQYLELKTQNFEFEGQSYLFWEYVRLLKEIKPKYFFLENVKMEEKWKIVLTNALALLKPCNCCGRYENLELTDINYHYKCKKTNIIEIFEPLFINSQLVSAQDRKRYYWTNISLNIPLPKDKNISFQDICETKGFSAAMRGRRINKNGKRVDYDTNTPIQQVVECRKDNKTNCITTVQKDNIVVIEKSVFKPISEVKYRYLTCIELERLQTLDDNYTNYIPKTHRTRVIGNCWTVDVIAHIFKYLNL